MHTYGSWPDEYFNQVEDAAHEIGTFCARFGRIGVTQTKEKFGTARVYCSIGASCIYSLLFPRHCWVKSWWPYRLDLTLSRWIIPIINILLVPFQKVVYRLSYKKVLKKYPHLKKEILYSADFYELLKDLED